MYKSKSKFLKRSKTQGIKIFAFIYICLVVWLLAGSHDILLFTILYLLFVVSFYFLEQTGSFVLLEGSLLKLRFFHFKGREYEISRIHSLDLDFVKGLTYSLESLFMKYDLDDGKYFYGPLCVLGDTDNIEIVDFVNAMKSRVPNIKIGIRLGEWLSNHSG